MRINGTLINYYFHCKRQCYLHGNRLNLEDNSEQVKIGKAIHEERAENSTNSEIAIENICLDKLTKEYLVEVKKSDADPESAKWQLLYYLSVLKKKGILRKGKLEFVEKNKKDKRLGVDVSVFQGDIDWEQVKAAGYEFAILRIGYRGYGEEGTLNADEKFEQNLENARKAGIDVGVYFFSQAVNEEEAKEEADFVLEHLKGKELQMPVVYDPEHILEDEARTDGVTGEQFTQNAKVFCKEIEEAGYDAMIYSNMLWEAYELDLEKLLDYPVWYADYEELPQTPYRFSMWQYSSTGSVTGIEGNVDLNIQLLKK